MQFGTVAKSVMTCVCVAGVGICYVWQKNQIYKLGDEIKKRESALLAAEKRGAMLASQVAQLKSPSLLEDRCQQYNLGLVSPRETQVVHLYEPGPELDVRFTPATAQVQSLSRKPTNRLVAHR